MIRIFARNANKQVVAQVKEFASFDCVLRDKDTSTWTISGSYVRGIYELILEGASILVERTIDGTTQRLIAGPTTYFSRTRDASGEVLTVSGVSEDVVLSDTIVYPGTMQTTPNGKVRFGDSKYLEFGGSAEDAMYFYANKALNDANKIVIGIPNYTMSTSQHRGAVVAEKARMDTLLEILKDINGQTAALTGESFGWKVTGNAFEVYPNQDKQTSAVFSFESGNLLSYSIEYTQPLATHVVIGANGEGTDRTYWRLGSDDVAYSKGRRIEVFIDGSEEEVAKLQKEAAKELHERGAMPSVSMTPIDIPNRTFGIDYNLGDVVTAQDYVAVLSEVAISVNSDGETVRPTAGAPSFTPSFSDAGAFRRMARRITQLETRT